MFSPKSTEILTPDEVAKTHPLDRPRTQVFKPNHVTARVVAQNGWFTVHKPVGKSWNWKWVPLEKNKKYKSLLVKLVIPSDAFESLAEQLDRFGINRASLFPDLDGLCSHIQWKYSKPLWKQIAQRMEGD